MEKPFSSKAQAVFYPSAEAEKARALLNLETTCNGMVAQVR